MSIASDKNTFDASASTPILRSDSVSITRRQLGGRFLHSSTELPLDRQQRKTAEALAEKVRSGVYRTRPFACAGCGHTRFTCIAESDRYQIPASFCLCSNCGLGAFNPRIDDNARHDFFSQHFSHLLYGGRDEPQQFELTKKSRGKLLNELLRRYQLARSGDLILDVGCGNGGVVSALLDQGFEAVGIDIHEQSLMYGKNERQLPLYLGSLRDADRLLKKRPRVILYMFSLEYVENIRQELAAVSDLMAENGFLLVVGLRLEKSILSRISLKFSLRFYLVHIFTPRTLGRIARAEGLQIVRHNMGLSSLFGRPVNHSVFIFKRCSPSDQPPSRFVPQWSRLKLILIEYCGRSLTAIRFILRNRR